MSFDPRPPEQRLLEAIFGRETAKESILRVIVKPRAKTLCASCKMGMLVRLYDRPGQAVYCNEISQWIRGRVEECSSYNARGTMGLWDMQKVAWLIKRDPKRIGFVRPGTKEYKDLTQEIPVIDTL